MSLPTFTVSLGSRQLFSGELSALDAWIAARRRITFFSICSGIEAATVAWKPLGWKHIGFAEIEKFPSAVLAHHYPNVPNHGDFTKIDTRRLPRIDILCGGTPCQAFSIAGARNSLDDARGNLTLAFVALAHDLADNNDLQNVVWENVPGVLSTHDNAFGCFLAGLVGADGPFVPALAKPAAGKSNRAYGWSAKSKSHYIKWPRAGLVAGPKGRAAWTVKDAQYYGLAQRRERVLVVADFGNGADPAAVLFEPESVPRHSPPSRETGERVAPTISARPTGGGGLGTDFDLDGGLIPSAVPRQWPVDIAPCLNAHFGEKQGLEDQHALNGAGLFVLGVTGPISHALKAEGADASEDGTGRGTPIVCVHGTQDPCVSEHTAFAMGRNTGQENVVAYSVALRGREDGATAELGSDVAFALRAAGGGDKPHILTDFIPEIAQPLRSNGYNNSDPNMEAKMHIMTGSAVRRLTPRECERLMGFPDDYTLIPWRGKPAALCPDGPRYKALGNSWAVPKFRWLGERIARLMPRR